MLGVVGCSSADDCVISTDGERDRERCSVNWRRKRNRDINEIEKEGGKNDERMVAEC